MVEDPDEKVDAPGISKVSKSKVFDPFYCFASPTY